MTDGTTGYLAQKTSKPLAFTVGFHYFQMLHPYLILPGKDIAFPRQEGVGTQKNLTRVNSGKKPFSGNSGGFKTPFFHGPPSKKSFLLGGDAIFLRKSLLGAFFEIPAPDNWGSTDRSFGKGLYGVPQRGGTHFWG